MRFETRALDHQKKFDDKEDDFGMDDFNKRKNRERDDVKTKKFNFFRKEK